LKEMSSAWHFENQKNNENKRRVCAARLDAAKATAGIEILT